MLSKRSLDRAQQQNCSSSLFANAALKFISSPVSTNPDCAKFRPDDDAVLMEIKLNEKSQLLWEQKERSLLSPSSFLPRGRIQWGQMATFILPLIIALFPTVFPTLASPATTAQRYSVSFHAPSATRNEPIHSHASARKAASRQSFKEYSLSRPRTVRASVYRQR